MSQIWLLHRLARRFATRRLVAIPAFFIDARGAVGGVEACPIELVLGGAHRARLAAAHNEKLSQILPLSFAAERVLDYVVSVLCVITQHAVQVRQEVLEIRCSVTAAELRHAGQTLSHILFMHAHVLVRTASSTKLALPAHSRLS